MRELNSIFVSCSIFCLSALILTADDAPKRDFGFKSMEIYKLDFGTHSLEAKDLDDDGLEDILFLNNSNSRLEILFRKKKADAESSGLLDDVFDNKGMMLDQQVASYKISDMNNDNRDDIITMGTPLGMYIRCQTNAREFSAPEHIFLNDLQDIMNIQIGDVNEDGLNDIVVSRRNSAEILWNDSKHTFLERMTIPYGNNDCYKIELIDANGDGHLDLLQYYRNQDASTKVRLGNGKGQFGLASTLHMPRMGNILVVEPRYKDPLMIAGILSNAKGLRLYEFEKTKQPVLLETQEFTPQKLYLPENRNSTTPTWVNTDINDDGFDDLIVSAPALSQLYLYKGSADGLTASTVKYDTLTEVNGLNVLKDGDLLAVSKKEKAVAIHRHADMQKFPELLDIEGDLITATAIKGTKSIYVLRREEESILLDHYEDTKLSESWPVELNNDPETIQAFSMENGQTGILMFIDYAQPEMVLINTNSIEKVDVAQFRALSQTLKPHQVLELSPGSGKSLVIAHGSTVRKYEWKNKSYEITQQFNPLNAQADAVLATMYHNEKKKGLLVYDRNSKDLLWYPENGNSNEPKKIHIADGKETFSGIVQLENKKTPTLIMIGPNEISLLVDGAEILELKEQSEYMSESEKPSLRIVKEMEVSSPSRPVLAIVDAANRSLEIISRQPYGIKHELTFPVFLRSDMVGPVNSRVTEPHDVVSGDVNGDGYDDVILLVHDKLLIYPGE
ncbi:MAG: VCBS repeat-containing protein [Kiritimatiellae bacterium]|jgi:hypothetical protein|nr:VCBS repeat-containing protein [Kiritimatiellia bacterium]